MWRSAFAYGIAAVTTMFCVSVNTPWSFSVTSFKSLLEDPPFTRLNAFSINALYTDSDYAFALKIQGDTRDDKALLMYAFIASYGNPEHTAVSLVANEY
jgi:hypothetical protein